MSSIPLSTKQVVAANQFKRALEASTSNGQDRGTDKIHKLLLNNDYPPDEIERAFEAAKKSNGRKKEKRSTFKSVVKLPFVHDRLARDVSRVVRRQFKDVRVVFTSGPSLRDMLVRSSSSTLVCPREERRLSQKKEKGRPPECRTCDAGMSRRKCVLKGVVYSMPCTVCDDLYIGDREAGLGAICRALS